MVYKNMALRAAVIHTRGIQATLLSLSFFIGGGKKGVGIGDGPSLVVIVGPARKFRSAKNYLRQQCQADFQPKPKMHCPGSTVSKQQSFFSSAVFSRRNMAEEVASYLVT